MSAVVIGSLASGGKILNSQSFTKELNGLVLLSEVYTVRGQDLASLTPANGTLHSAYSTANTTYSTLSVERASGQSIEGNLAQITVDFVGIIGALPPALVRLIPVAGAGIFGPPVIVEAEFVTNVSENAIVNGSFGEGTPIISGTYKTSDRASGSRIAGGTDAGVKINTTQINIQNNQAMPLRINGTKMPDNPKQPYINDRSVLGQTILERYYGYVKKDLQTQRRGNYLVVIATFQESFEASVQGLGV